MFVIYSTDACPKCDLLGRHLKKKNIVYRKINVEEDEEERTKLVMKNIFALPVLKSESGKMLLMKEMFVAGSELNQENVDRFVGSGE